MNKQRAKEILLRCRPWAAGKDEEEDSALKAAESNPDLGALRDKSEQFNSRVRQELRDIPVPNHLRDQILAGRKVIPVQHWSQPKRLLAIAAGLLFFTSTVFYFSRPAEDQSIAGFRARMVGFALREYRMDLFTQDLGELKRYLAAKGRPADFPLPPNLTKRPLKGGASLAWQGKPVSMVCFDWTGGETLYMFVLPEQNRTYAKAQVETVKKLTTAVWSSDQSTFVLAGRIPEKALTELLQF